MAKFTYTGQASDGTKVVKTVDAADRYAVYEVARTEGHSVDSISEAGSFSIQNFIDVEKINYYISRVKEDELVLSIR